MTTWQSSIGFSVTWSGVVAQLVERLNGIQEVRGSNPLGSTSYFNGKKMEARK